MNWALPSMYLGLPLGASHKAVAVWYSVEERMHKRLALWKRSYISNGGRITLIKSSLASLPLNQMPLVRMPVFEAQRLEKLQRDFLWGGGGVNKKPHLVKWEVVCTSKDQGGLGLKKTAPLEQSSSWQNGL